MMALRIPAGAYPVAVLADDGSVLPIVDGWKVDSGSGDEILPDDELLWPNVWPAPTETQ